MKVLQLPGIRQPNAPEKPYLKKIVGNSLLAYYRQVWHNSFCMPNRRKQLRHRLGAEKAFGETMRTMRKELGMSQMDLYTKTGLDRTFISDLERGVQCPSLRTILRIAAGLNIAPGSLVRRTAESPYFIFPTDE